MRKAEMIRAVAEKSQQSKVAVEAVLEAFGIVVVGSMDEANKIPLANLGAFHIKKMPPRTARNPRTGESVTVPERMRLSFKVSKPAAVV